MYASQINQILSRDRKASMHFKGVFPADKLPSVESETALVVNTDTHNEEGTHWLAMYVKDAKTLEFFDSFGLSPSTYEPFISRFASNFPIIKWNGERFQSLTSNVCGQYCTYFLLKRCNGFSMDCILNNFHYYKKNDFRLYYFFKKRYGVKLIFKK